MQNKETILFDQVIFGPVKSRRLGISLGVNLLPVDSKLCNFDCIYCECGRNASKRISIGNSFHPRNKVKEDLENKLIKLKEIKTDLDVITFAGNGEPTMHPEFATIIGDTIEVRNIYFPNTKVAVLTNATMLNKKSVVDALNKIDLRILKLDAGTEALFQQINQPRSRRYLSWIVDHLQYFDRNFIVQSMFLKGKHNGVTIDNTTDENVNAWLDLLAKIKPKQVMIYSIDRATAEKGLIKISEEKLYKIALKVEEIGFHTVVS